LTADAVGIHVSKKRRAGSNSFSMNGDAPGKRKTAQPRISRNRFAVRAVSAGTGEARRRQRRKFFYCQKSRLRVRAFGFLPRRSGAATSMVGGSLNLQVAETSLAQSFPGFSAAGFCAL
jgi:hypothetical protein